jgi:preprotein translocase subunit SecA
VTRAIENAQRKVEGRNFDIRKQLLEYDDVANDQRKVIYEQRNRLMDVDDISDSIANIRRDVADQLVSRYIPPESLEEQWDVAGLEEYLAREFGLQLTLRQWLEQESGLTETTLRERIFEGFDRMHEQKTAQIGVDVMRHLEKAVMLQVLDTQWKDHLAAMDYLRQGIHLRGYAQKNPKEEYKREAFALFSTMLERIRQDVVSLLARVQLQNEASVETLERPREPSRMEFVHPSADSGGMPSEEGDDVAVATAKPVTRDQPKVGRNEPCPCGSGKKFKHCHGKLT